ncbi:MAG: sigma-70 family RNA polymerase sigma factor [Chloroflexota bacterium]|jgi:RNA polymerase sigma-70 factor (ECF subfamily)|nr:sigma-70 family RNA polymerase sigma factor [Chloroflexota bacterium]MDP6509289.1 sigma-70 family RNA polymerase sigma factor [Chloroflexota bacterium]
MNVTAGAVTRLKQRTTGGRQLGISGGSGQTQPDDLDEIILRATRLDRDAFGYVYREFAPRIHRFVAYRTNNRTLADDLTNQIFMQALRAIGRYQHRSVPEFTAWIFRIARNAIADHWRRNRNDVSLDPDVHLRDQVDEGGDFVRIDNADMLSQALEHLTPEQAEVIAMRFSQGMSHAQIAAILDKKEPAVRALQFRALTTLRSLISREPAE